MPDFVAGACHQIVLHPGHGNPKTWIACYTVLFFVASLAATTIDFSLGALQSIGERSV